MRYYDIANDWYKNMIIKIRVVILNLFYDGKNPLIDSTDDHRFERNHVYVSDVYYTRLDDISRKYSQKIFSLSSRRDEARFAKFTLVGGIFVGMRKLGQWRPSEIRQIAPFPELSPILKNGDIGQCRWTRIATRHSSSGAREKQYIVWQSHVSYVYKFYACKENIPDDIWHLHRRPTVQEPRGKITKMAATAAADYKISPDPCHSLNS